MAQHNAPESKLAPLLRDLSQGDLLTLGAVTIVGRGNTPTKAAAGGGSPSEEIWSVTVESDLGWYVIVSGACDIVRDPSIEPCLAVAPIATVSKERYQQLRSGEYSPREFPLPAQDVAKIIGRSTDDFWPVVDLRYISSVDKHALLSDRVSSRRPLTGPQQRRFSIWVGRRFNRPAHSDEIQSNVLDGAGERISKLAVRFARTQNPGALPTDVRLVGAAREWLVGGTERAIRVCAVIDEGSAKASGLYVTSQEEIDVELVVSAQRRLTKTLRATLPSDSGYSLSVETLTLDGISAAEYLSLDPWLWADRSDPLLD